ncbi:hypothetical protein [Diplocloster hominis]
MTKQELDDMMDAEEKRLKLGNEEFKRRHQEIMSRIRKAEERIGKE